MANKRVIDMQELSELGDGWYTFLDSATGGTKKFDMGNMLNATADAQDAAEAAQSAATSAREAADGVVSPTVTPSQITGGTRVTITDVDGTRTFDVMDGPQGEKGDTGDPAAPGSITTDMLADGAVTPDKLAPGVADGYQPALVAGSSRAMLGDPETASWTERTTAADGAALVEAVRGNTVVQDGSLLPVRMTGIETAGFNQWDEAWDNGDINSTTGQNTTGTTVRSKGYVPVIPGLTYYFKCPVGNMYLWAYGADKGYLGRLGPSGLGNTGNVANATVTIPASVRFVRFRLTDTYGATYLNDVCINISDHSRNGTYEPYWSSERTIPAATYFPDGMRSAGSAYDELRADAAVTRVGAVDLGTLSWEKYDLSGTAMFRSYGITNIKPAVAAWTAANVLSAQYPTYGSEGVASHDKGVAVSQGAHIIYLRDSSFDSLTANEAKTALSGVYLFYELDTVITVPIDPPLPMSYRVGRGGTERVMVASGTTSAPPIFVTRYPLDPADLAASIAPVDGPIAKTNHQVGDLLMLGFTLCKATQVIVTGEVIEIGTNVTRTTVAAELAALSQ